MNILDVDLYKHLPEIVEIYTELFGERYRSIIEKRVYNTKYVYYRTFQGVIGYHAFLRHCKSKELGIRFLKEIGIEVDMRNEGSFADPYSEESRELLLNYLGSSFTRIGFMDEEYSLSGIKSFDESRLTGNKDDYYKQKYTRISQIRMINFLRGNEEIDEFNYDDFKQTQEFTELKRIIEQYYEVYKRLLNEYHRYISEIEIYSEYSRREAKRRKSISEKYNNDWKNRADDIEGEETETSEDFARNVDLHGDKRNSEKMKIAFINRQVCVQELIGTEWPVLFFTLRSYDDGGKIDYMFLHEMCHVIGTSIRTKTNDEKEEDDLRKVDRAGEFRSDLLSDSRVKSGLDCLSDFQFNPYNKYCRKYERLNETITDLFAMEARKRLHGRGMYLFEDRDISIEDISNDNTSVILKRMIAPLIKEYSEELKQAMTGDDISPLTNKLGIDNFEEINDCINIVDALLTGNLHIEYDENERENAIKVQEERCDKVFKRIKTQEKSKCVEER